MKTFGWMIAIVTTVSSAAYADGFRCEGLTFGTKIEVYNKVKASQGTRNVSVMIVSDPASLKGERTIATFNQIEGSLIQKGATYIATVGDRYRADDKKIADTTLRNLETIELTVNFNYTADTPTRIGDKYAGLITYNKDDGSTTTERANCIRYKKN